MATFIKTPFADTGDKTAIPDTDGAGNVNMATGYGFDYERPATDAGAKDIERNKFNYLMNIITSALNQYQTHGAPDFITTSDNGGSPFSYGISSLVRFDNGTGFANYVSLVAANTSDPTDTTKWQRVLYTSQIPVGTIWQYDLTALPAGWIWANGQTIGSTSSGADRPNVDAQALFLATWASYPNAQRPILNSDGSVGTRGASANADWVANKRLPVRDMCGNVAAGLETMGGRTSPGRLPGLQTGGINGSVLGAAGGEAGHQLTIPELAAHTHGYRIVNVQPASGSLIGGFTTIGTVIPNQDPNSNILSNGSDAPHNNVQPTTISNFILKL